MVVDTDPFWYNRLLLELDVDYADYEDEDGNRDVVTALSCRKKYHEYQLLAKMAVFATNPT